MFTGIIECTGIIREIVINDSNKTFWIESPISQELKADQSLNHDGVCLTVEKVEYNIHQVTTIAETLEKTNFSQRKTGDYVNLERSLLLDSRIDGHFVQGHVDCIGICAGRKEKGGSWEFDIRFPKKYGSLVIEKGSVCVNGISLTAFKVTKRGFRVGVIPYTFHQTNMQYLEENSPVNLEFDVLGKYILNYLKKRP